MTKEVFEREFGAYLKQEGIEHFSARECCPVGKVAIHPNKVRAVLEAPPRFLWPNIIPTLKVVEWLRAEIGHKTIIVNSGYRDELYNAAVRGESGSMHTKFRALDIFVPSFAEQTDIYNILAAHPKQNTFGLGRYQNFTHIDTRGYRARW